MGDKADRDRWLTIELRHLAALATVAQRESFSDAADSLGYAQSAVSHQISGLERIVGRRLVDRAARPRSVSVTEAGRTLTDRIDPILEHLRLAKAEIDALREQPAPAVRLGIDHACGSRSTAALLGALLAATGGRGWDRVERDDAARLLERVGDGELDAALVPLPVASGPYFALEVTREPCVLVAPPGAAFHRGDVEEVLRRWPLAATDAAGALRVTSGPDLALRLVRAGVASAVVSAADVTCDVVSIRMPGLPDRVMGLAWHRAQDGAPAIRLLKAAARAAAG